MGWARMLLLGDLGQQMDIEQARATVDRLRSTMAGQASTDAQQDEAIAQLSSENEQLKLCVSVLIRLLVAKHVLTEADVAEVVGVLDPASPDPDADPLHSDPEETPTDALIALADVAKGYRPG